MMEATKRKSKKTTAESLGTVIASAQAPGPGTEIDSEIKTPPEVAAVRPNLGPALGGTVVRVKGANFRPRSRVQFGSRNALSVVYVDAQTLICITPPGKPGFVDVAVTNPSGLRGVLPRGFLYLLAGQVAENVENAREQLEIGSEDTDLPDEVDKLGESGIDLQQQPPVVTSVVPNNVTTNGGKMVTIKGSNFRAGSTVTFGMIPAANVRFIDRQTLTCVPQPHVAGNVKVRVTNQGSGLTGTLSMGFTYIQAPPPVLASIAPDTIPAFGNQGINVNGARFAPGCSILLGAGKGPANFVSEFLVGFTAPPAPRGTIFQVGVQNPDGQIACCALLRYV